MEYIFTLRFHLPKPLLPEEQLLQRLIEAGCDDALVGLGVPGKVALEFTRDASSAKRAVLSAIQQVQNAVPDAQLIEAAPDFVGLTDVADIIGVSRQNMRKLMLSHSSHFPQPVHDGKTALWHLADVLEWLEQRGNYAIPAETRDLAQVTLLLNLQQAMQRYAHCLAAAADVGNQ
ncbi:MULTISPECIES: helix-turn-helix transcriptional regulator [Pantoea]|uniref:helix-turn-helix transcriptional regulator n=1 Tax=Pantoea TaxID=53335 RepID=UPI00257F8A8C|nr:MULTISPECIES: DNA-binding protein [Pantoea]MDU5471786.1 DNA-binding protein [Pantoea sp.]